MTGELRSGVAPPTVSAPAVALRIADFLIATETERFRLFHLHLRATVRLVSPLLLDLAALEGIALADATQLIYPPKDWPWRPLHDVPPDLARSSRQRLRWLGAKGRNEGREFRRAFANPGVIVRPVEDPRGRFAIRPVGSVLGFTASVGSGVVSAFGRTALLRFAEPLPETLMIAMPGRMLGQVVDHPAFAGRDYRIRQVMADPSDGLPVVSFAARLVEATVPFGDHRSVPGAME